MGQYLELDQCVACGASGLFEVLDLGNQPLANDYLDVAIPHQLFPLVLNACSICFHMQLSVAVEPARLFRSYSYVSGTSNTLLNYFKWLRDRILADFKKPGKILDIGSNDGTFLSTFNDSSWKKIGVDPASNLVSMALNNGVITLPTFFNRDTADLLATDFDVIVAMNVFAHTSDPLEILNGIKRALSPDGTVYIQTSQANILKLYQFDTVYHEHISFFNVRSMKLLLSRAGLALKNVEMVPVHGESYLWVITHDGGVLSKPQREIDEEGDGLYDLENYSDFKIEALSQIGKVKAAISEHVDMGYAIASYGAAAKGNTFLNFGRIDLDFVFDDTPLKIGRFAPAGNCKVSEPSTMKQIESPVLFLIPAWNFKSEILANISRIRENNLGDKFLVYYPDFEIGPIN
jgi:2-polyprenyl-3-methyl-5-hydroxy-6-metoxy-1,4-benzoquinol methylase